MGHALNDTIFTWAAPALKVGLGALRETGYELGLRKAHRVLLITDRTLRRIGWPDRVAASITGRGIDCVVYDGAHIEPTDASINEAVAFARSGGPWDAFVAVGGGSAMDTAKAVTLLTTNPGELADYLNRPVGRALPPTAPLRPLIAIPTTAGTGAECTALSITIHHRRSGIAGEDRHQPPVTAAGPGDHRSTGDGDDAGRGDGRLRDGRTLPCVGILHRPAV